MISTNEGYTRLEYFSEDVAADKNRKEFDIKNHTLCYTNQRPDFLFIGDSITEYWELNAYFRNSDQLIINRGIAGDTTKYLKKRFYVDAVQLAINRVNFGKGIYRTLMIIPWAFPSIVIALSWKWILNGVSGFIPNILVQLGICNELPQFLSDNSFVFLTLIFINIWFGAPMIMVNVLSALQTIPQDQYEAAQIDGASKVQQFWYITVPHIKVVVGLLVVLRTIWVFNNFDIIYLLTGGGPANATTTMPIYAYNMGWNTKLLGRSSAVTMLLLAFLLLVCVIYFTIIGKWEKEDK